MRIDKMISEMGIASRREVDKAARKGSLLVNGVPQKDSSVHIDPTKDEVTFCGERVAYAPFVYLMLNKPEGYVSATDDRDCATVLDLIPDSLRARELFPCGRLDKYTTGLMLLTNDGALAHRLLAPKSHVCKVYEYGCEAPLSQEDAKRLERGVYIEGGYLTKPAIVKLDDTDASSGIITLREGKYHQIKRMLEATQNKITYLERVTFGPLVLDADLSRGEWRFLSKEEERALFEAVDKQ